MWNLSASAAKGRKLAIGLLLLVLAAVGCGTFLHRYGIRGRFAGWSIADETFRAMEISPQSVALAKELEGTYDISSWDLLASAYMHHRTDPNREVTEPGMLAAYRTAKRLAPDELGKISDAMEQVWSDVVCFPVPRALASSDAQVAYENTWMDARTFGGNRSHEGTDIMASLNQPEYYPVMSITDGVVEKVGWLRLGGYRIGIRSPHGGYFYYAHLSSYSQDFLPGDPVKAGDLLGMMGNTGYSDVEGASGNFPVHLHVGVYLNQPDGEEISVNPYWVLQYAGKNMLQYYY